MDITIAQTIVDQLGGHRFRAMTGVKRFIASEHGVSFMLPRTYNKINAVRIELNGLDLYDVEFCWVSMKRPWKTISVHTDVYNDGLQDLFTAATGLHTHL